MRKFLIILFTLCLLIPLSLRTFAEEVLPGEAEESDMGKAENGTSDNTDNEIKEYIEEKIIPIVIGVLTSAGAFLCTIRGIYKLVSSLKNSKEIFSEAQKDLTDTVIGAKEQFRVQIASLYEQVSEVCNLEDDILCLKKSVEQMTVQIQKLCEITCLGFSADEKVLSSGKAEKMAIMCENESITGEDK